MDADLSPTAVTGIAGRVVAVTGAGSGIGRFTALLAARSGASVVGGDINPEALGELAAIAATQGLDIRCVHLDLADPSSIDDFLSEADRGGALYGVVNAAGIAAECPALDITLETWLHYQAVLLTGPFLMAQGAARRLVAREAEGSIVNVSSAAALVGPPNRAHYTAAKGGLVSLTKVLAREWGPHGIRVNTVSPGAIDTPLYHAQATRHDVISSLPIPRIGTPEDVAMAIGFFLGNQSPWITGQNLNINGGSFMH